MLSVDPSKILSMIINRGGLLVSESVEKYLKVLAKMCNAEECHLNVLEKKLLLRNFSVRLPNQDDALRIGKFSLQWGSYLRPCLEIEVDDVHILVEFFNLLLTKNNWDELSKNGFPPEFAEEEEPNHSAEQFSSFLRIGSIDLSGTVSASLKSQTLKKEIAQIVFDLDNFDPLDREIRNQSLENLANLGRRGCTTDELYSLIQAYFGRQLRQVLSDTFEDLAGGGEGTMREVNRLVNLTKGPVRKYMGDAGKMTGKRVQKRWEKSSTTGEYQPKNSWI